MAEAKPIDGRSMIRRRAGLRLWLSAGWLTLLCAVALLAPWIAPKDPLAQDLFLGRLPPFWVQGAEPGYWLGTDSLGRDVLSRILHGARVALAVALVAGRVPIEASGGVRLDTIAAIAATGVTYVSVGRLTQSAPAADIGLDFTPL